MQAANPLGPFKGLRPYQALIGPTQASGLAGGFDSTIVIIYFKTASLSDDFDNRARVKSFSPKVQKCSKSRGEPGEKQKRNEKRARGNEFPRTLMGVIIQGQCACFAGDKLNVLT